MIYLSLGPSIFEEISMVDQVDHKWMYSVLVVLSNPKVVRSIHVNGAVETNSIVMVILPCAYA